MASSSKKLSFYDFLDKMRNPSSIDLVRSIKSFIVSFSFTATSSEDDGKKLQNFLLDMEAVIREHPLWLGASEEEIDCAIEGLEKYVMTKLFNRTFASSPEDFKLDQEISEKINMLQYFLRPNHLDIPESYHNEASWLLAEKELQKMNAFRAPREKLLCILSCCRVINNLLLNATMSQDRVPGADAFLPVLIYVVIKANPPRLHSNLSYIQLYRRQSKLVSESAYYFTNLVSAKSFIVNLDATSLSIDKSEFQEKMEMARLKAASSSDETAVTPLHVSKTSHRARQNGILPTFDDIMGLVGHVDYGPARGKRATEVDTEGSLCYPFMEAEAGELTVEDVDALLRIYKDVVNKYTSLRKAVEHLAVSKTEPALDHSQESNIKMEQLEEKIEKHHEVPI